MWVCNFAYQSLAIAASHLPIFICGIFFSFLSFFVLFRSTDYESSLLESSRDNVQLLLNKIFDLPSENMPGDMGRLAVLPKTTTPLPREKPSPKPKAPTKWEQFAQLKGIVKRKRSRMVFDEDTQEYKPRFGYKRANDPSQQLVIEHKEGEGKTKYTIVSHNREILLLSRSILFVKQILRTAFLLVSCLG